MLLNSFKQSAPVLQNSFLFLRDMLGFYCYHLLQLQSISDLQETIETIQKCSCDDDCSCEAQFLKHGGVWNSVHTNASKRLRIGRSPEVQHLLNECVV